MNYREEGSSASVSIKLRFSRLIFNTLNISKKGLEAASTQPDSSNLKDSSLCLNLLFNSMVTIETVCCNRLVFTD